MREVPSTIAQDQGPAALAERCLDRMNRDGVAFATGVYRVRRER